MGRRGVGHTSVVDQRHPRRAAPCSNVVAANMSLRLQGHRRPFEWRSCPAGAPAPKSLGCIPCVRSPAARFGLPNQVRSRIGGTRRAPASVFNSSQTYQRQPNEQRPLDTPAGVVRVRESASIIRPVAGLRRLPRRGCPAARRSRCPRRPEPESAPARAGKSRACR